ncbi:MAG TPA: glycosyltransferase family 2 protein [Acidimicrobiales bacterium]|nr:glycosyltransferase family 2 protein [Acidimicrobiales bacterium]
MNESRRPVVDSAVAAFNSEYGTGPGRALCVVIAALNEVGAVAGVVESLPPSAAGLDLDCIVVDDGSSDGTADAAGRAGAMVCRFERNLGQGWALRAGYRLAAARGATVVATMDADGQFDAGELDRIVGPVAEGTADMVVGSRRLGRSEVGDRVRATGVVAFARLISLLTGHRVTDPSSGYRAFLTEVPQRVPLRQAQYQASELLIGAISLGFRVAEVPMTVRARVAGRSKKGANLLYGWRFTGVVVTTWWRMRRVARSQPGR